MTAKRDGKNLAVLILPLILTKRVMKPEIEDMIDIMSLETETEDRVTAAAVILQRRENTITGRAGSMVMIGRSYRR